MIKTHKITLEIDSFDGILVGRARFLTTNSIILNQPTSPIHPPHLLLTARWQHRDKPLVIVFIVTVIFLVARENSKKGAKTQNKRTTAV